MPDGSETLRPEPLRSSGRDHPGGFRSEVGVQTPAVTPVALAAPKNRNHSERVFSMSDGQAFDPSVLERKERSELVTIVETLGGKVAARATKPTIVKQILSLVGHDEDEATPAPELAPEPAPHESDAGSAPAFDFDDISTQDDGDTTHAGVTGGAEGDDDA